MQIICIWQEYLIYYWIICIKYSHKIAYRSIGLMGRVFDNGPEDRGLIPGRVIAKTQKWYKIPPYLTLFIIRYIKGKVEQSRENGSLLSYTSV